MCAADNQSARGSEIVRSWTSAESGHIMATRYEIVLSPDAVNALGELPAYKLAEVRDALQRHLRHEPTKASKSRIKRLRGLSQPQYRLRVGEIRVFYDVANETVEILTIVAKSQAQAWLTEHGASESKEGAPREPPGGAG